MKKRTIILIITVACVLIFSLSLNIYLLGSNWVKAERAKYLNKGIAQALQAVVAESRKGQVQIQTGADTVLLLPAPVDQSADES